MISVCCDGIFLHENELIFGKAGGRMPALWGEGALNRIITCICELNIYKREYGKGLLINVLTQILDSRAVQNFTVPTCGPYIQDQ